MPYASYRESGTEKYAEVDIKRFATDLCKAMGGTDLLVEVREERASFMVGLDKLRIGTSRWSAKPEVNFYLETPDVSAEDIKQYGGGHTERASVNPDARSIEKIAADIKRRVVDGSAEVTAKRRAKAAEYAGIRQGLAEVTPALKQLGFDVSDEARSNGLVLRALGPEPTSMSVRVTHEAFEINRVCGLSLDQLKRIVAIVNEPSA